MKTVLITGCSGFLGKHLKEELISHGYQVIGLSKTEKDGFIQCNILNKDGLFEIVHQYRPDIVFHLAGQAKVSRSWIEPQKTFEENVVGTINLLETIRACGIKCRIINVGSSDQYGSLGGLGHNVDEMTVMRPQNPYAVSKLAQENICRVYCNTYLMDICMVRAFNTAGPGQRAGFVFSDFCSEIVLAEHGKRNTIKVGNLFSKRDFTHVKDVARAFRLVAEKGNSGETYNIGSGFAHSAKEILDSLISASGVKVNIETDASRFRPTDTPVICCNHTRLTEDTGWMPIYDFENIVRDTLGYYRDVYERNQIMEEID